MHLVIEFNTELLDSNGEPKNPINDLRGHTLATYFSECLRQLNIVCTPVEPEDWGWFFDVIHEKRGYMIGFIEHKDLQTEPKFMIQIHKSRALIERLTGKEKLTHEDTFASLVTKVIEQNLEATDVHSQFAG